MKIPHTYVFLPNTKTYGYPLSISYLYTSRIPVSSIRFARLKGARERLERCGETASRKLLVLLAQPTDIWTRKKFCDCRIVD
jgi:hypothetical protein